MARNRYRASKFYQEGVLNIAHRGARAFAPENTLFAFEKAKAFGCHMFEVDVHCSKDGVLIVHHDDTLTRCTDVEKKFPGLYSYFLSDFSYEQLLQLDAGSWFVDQLSLPREHRQGFLQSLTDQEIDSYITVQDQETFSSGEIKVPTLQQTLELARKLGLIVNIEIKALPRLYPGIADATVALVEKLSMQDQVLISSFDHEQLYAIRQSSMAIATAVLTSDRLEKPAAYLKLLDADCYHPGYDALGFNSVSGQIETRGVASVRQAGFGVNVWTVNDRSEIQQLIASGVNGVFSDYPNRVNDVLTL